MLAALRGARHGDVLALHILMLCATGRTPTEIAAWLFCSRSSVYRIVLASGRRLGPPARRPGLLGTASASDQLDGWPVV
jgi:Homeodomain-like domain